MHNQDLQIMSSGYIFWLTAAMERSEMLGLFATCQTELVETKCGAVASIVYSMIRWHGAAASSSSSKVGCHYLFTHLFWAGG